VTDAAGGVAGFAAAGFGAADFAAGCEAAGCVAAGFAGALFASSPAGADCANASDPETNTTPTAVVKLLSMFYPPRAGSAAQVPLNFLDFSRGASLAVDSSSLERRAQRKTHDQKNDSDVRFLPAVRTSWSRVCSATAERALTRG
jgi:hypothetical protein